MFPNTQRLMTFINFSRCYPWIQLLEFGVSYNQEPFLPSPLLPLVFYCYNMLFQAELDKCSCFIYTSKLTLMKKKESKTPMSGCVSRESLWETGCSIAQVQLSPAWLKTNRQISRSSVLCAHAHNNIRQLQPIGRQTPKMVTYWKIKNCHQMLAIRAKWIFRNVFIFVIVNRLLALLTYCLFSPEKWTSVESTANRLQSLDN